MSGGSSGRTHGSGGASLDTNPPVGESQTTHPESNSRDRLYGGYSGNRIHFNTGGGAVTISGPSSVGSRSQATHNLIHGGARPTITPNSRITTSNIDTGPPATSTFGSAPHTDGTIGSLVSNTIRRSASFRRTIGNGASAGVHNAGRGV